MLNRDVAFLGIAANDEPGYAMDDHFGETMEFLDQCRVEGRRVLVHCVAGINRSSTALIAFLCASLQMDLEDAVELTSRQRGSILSNSSFLEQLVESFGEAPARKQTILSAL
jgi:protein-tyrosine phosphatase